MIGDTTDQVVFLLVVALRLIVPLGIPRFPLPAIVAAMLIDAVDLNIFQLFGEVDPSSYQGYDKALDVYYLAVAYLAAFRNWTSVAAFEVGRILIYVRLAGVVLFEITGAREFLLLFPNTFEYYFIAYEVIALRWSPTRFSKQQYGVAAAVIWVLIKLPQEYWIHVAQLDVTDELSSHPAIIPGLATAAALATTVVWWIVTRQFPVPDRRMSITGAQDEPVAALAYSRGNGSLVSRVANRLMFEKIVLISLVCVIFGQVLPDVRSESVELAFGVSLLIVTNTIVSEWLTRRGVGWRTAFHQFLAMAVLNVAISMAFYILLPLGDGFIHIGNTLFFLLLLTLLIVMYDRYRPYYASRTMEAQQARRGQRLVPRPTSA